MERLYNTGTSITCTNITSGDNCSTILDATGLISCYLHNVEIHRKHDYNSVITYYIFCKEIS